MLQKPVRIKFKSPNSQLGDIEARLANSEAEIHAAQSLRYKVFCGEWGATADNKQKIEHDKYDPFCDHLIVINKTNGEIIAACRLLGDAGAKQAGGFYTQAQFSLTSFGTDNLSHIELSRVCIAPEHRSKRIMELIWHSIWMLCQERKIDVMFGCASFVGTQPQAYKNSLGWLYKNALLAKSQDFKTTSPHNFKLANIAAKTFDEKKTFAKLPTLLKGYLRLGAKIASCGVIDHAFGTLDVLVILRVKDISQKYLNYYAKDSKRFEIA